MYRKRYIERIFKTKWKWVINMLYKEFNLEDAKLVWKQE